MEKQKKVIDASVIAKLFLNEESSDKALTIVKEYLNNESELIIPEFAIIEVMNALRYKKKTEEIMNANREIWELQFKIQKVNKQVLDNAINIALKNDFTIYDSIYISLAQINSCPLITADTALYKSPNVIPLEKCC